ncbi:MAG TPA: hypothetical protein VIK54_10990 [Acidimicrobiia bacterium]
MGCLLFRRSQTARLAAVVVLIVATTCVLAGLDSESSRAVALGAPDAGQVIERTWVAVAGAPQPPRDGAMAYDTVRHQTVLLVPGHPSQTWVFDGGTRRWSQKFPTTSPSLAAAVAAFDAARGSVVVFGSNANAQTCDPLAMGETWTWNGSTWAQQHPAAAPDECSGLGAVTMAYDAARNEVVVLGGANTSATWLWNGTNWRYGGTGVAAETGTPMAYDPTSRQVIAFGGYFFFHGDNDFGQTWAWDGTKWTQLSAGGGPRDPRPRGFAAMTYDPAVGAPVLFGGVAHIPIVQSLSDTWRWVGTHWVRMGTSASPPAMAGASFVYDTDHHFGVLFGGSSRTWLFTAANAGGGYFLGGRDGSVYALGNARSFGSAASIRLQQPIVGIARTVTRGGYWLVAADGGVFSYGDATFHGSTGSIHLNQPVVGLAPTPTGDGYWLVARDGGVFSYGDATFHGSAAPSSTPIVAIASSPSGNGYWLFAANGTVTAFGDAQAHGNLPGTPRAPIVSATPT